MTTVLRYSPQSIGLPISKRTKSPSLTRSNLCHSLRCIHSYWWREFAETHTYMSQSPTQKPSGPSQPIKKDWTVWPTPLHYPIHTSRLPEPLQFFLFSTWFLDPFGLWIRCVQAYPSRCHLGCVYFSCSQWGLTMSRTKQTQPRWQRDGYACARALREIWKL